MKFCICGHLDSVHDDQHGTCGSAVTVGMRRLRCPCFRFRPVTLEPAKEFDLDCAAKMRLYNMRPITEKVQ